MKVEAEQNAPSIADVETELRSALVDLGDAQRHATQARMRETDCLNRVNRLQKKIDEHVDALRKAAPSGTEWREAQARRAVP